MSDVLENLLTEIDQSNRNVLTALVWSWMLGVNLLQFREDSFQGRAMTPAEATSHEYFLSNLIKLGHFIAPRIRNLSHREQDRFVLEQDRLLALVKGPRVSADLVPIALNKEMVSFFLSEWRPWATERKDIL